MTIPIINDRALRKLNTIVLLAGGASIVFYTMYGTKPPLEDGFNLFLIWAWVIPLILMSAFTYFPYYVFYRMSRKIYSIASKPSLHYICFALSVIVILVSWKLYYVSNELIQGSKSSTASLIFAVLPIYILIGGSICYGILQLGAKNNA